MSLRCKYQLLLLQVAIFNLVHSYYNVDDSLGLGAKFDGIGGLSGGGATSRLLVNYNKAQLDEILDYLFKPKFGAALHTLKVEIGGDAQSSDGTEPSHMHSQDDENFNRGYEWYLMVQAKKRNPNIQLYAIPWAFPRWVGNGTASPYTYPDITAKYITKWVIGAKQRYNLTIDYIGIWNERQFNCKYIKILRKSLNANGFKHTKIVAADGGWQEILDAIKEDPELAAVVDVIGAHYPGTKSPKESSGKPLWASEDYSTVNNDIGGGCLARIINQNYVNGNMSSTIAWNLIASYYNGLPYSNDGLMTANEPWSGYYEVKSPIWVTAHTTQFVDPGWFFLRHGTGSGHLEKNGSYVTYIDPNRKKFVIVIEAMSHNHSKCIRPPLPAYTITNQTAVFKLKGSLKNTVKNVNLWSTCLSFNGPSKLFDKIGTLEVIDNSITIRIQVDCMYTITNTEGQSKGHYNSSQHPSRFPLPYSDNFDKYAISSEARYFADQSGVFEIHKSKLSSRGNVMRQMLSEPPISWCVDAAQPISLIGNSHWQDITIRTDFLIEGGEGVLIGARIGNGGCDVQFTAGIILRIASDSSFTLSEDLGGVFSLISGKLPTTLRLNIWYTAQLTVKGGLASAKFDNQSLFDKIFVAYSSGFAAIGSLSFNHVQFDNFKLQPV